MERYVVSARKYRPATFASVVGQKALTATLKNSIAQNRLAHAYLFCGSRGVGKTSCARIFAKTINCANPTADGEACNSCESCRDFNEGRSLNIVELDAASNNGVEDIRSLTDQVQVPPSLGRYRVFIVDEVHMLSSAAFNAFLKTLEEPPSYVVFILATTEKHKIIPTILSRCQIYDFSRITVTDMVDHLSYVAAQEGIEAERAALNVIARKADGAMRDALSIFDQVAASSMGHITYASAIENLNVLDLEYYNRLLSAFLSGNVTDSLLIYKDIRDKGFNNHFFLTGLGDYFRDLVVARDPRTLELLESDREHRDQMAALAAKCTPQFLYRAMELCNKADLDYRSAANKQFLVELTLIRLCQADSPSPQSIDGEGEGLDFGPLRPIAVTAPTYTPRPAPAAPANPAPANPAPAPAPAAPRPAAPVPPAQAPVPQPPRPAAPVPPAQAPVPQPPRPAVKATSLGPGISIRPGSRHQAAAAAAAATLPAGAPAQAAKRQGEYTTDSITSAWMGFIEANPSAHILVNTMRVCRPVRGAMDHEFMVRVESPAQEQTLMASMPQITRHVRDAVANDSVTFRVEMVKGQGSPRTWTEHEVLQHMVKEHPLLQRLVDKLKLTLN